MLEGTLEGTVGFLALLGAVALVLRGVRSALALVLRAAELASASGMAEASARRGDITSLEDARRIMGEVRARRRQNGLVTAGWIAWLVVPLALGWLPEAWALAAPLWLLPRSSQASAGAAPPGI